MKILWGRVESAHSGVIKEKQVPISLGPASIARRRLPFLYRVVGAPFSSSLSLDYREDEKRAGRRNAVGDSVGFSGGARGDRIRHCPV